MSLIGPSWCYFVSIPQWMGRYGENRMSCQEQLSGKRQGARHGEKRIVRLAEAIERTGLSSSTLYRLMGSGRFVQAVKLSERAIGFHQRELDEWIETRKHA
jgi:prophage regulatory protein